MTPPLAKQGDVGKLPQFFSRWGEGPLKVGEDSLTKLRPGIVQQYDAVVFSSKDDLYMNPCQHQSHIERKGKPTIAKASAKILDKAENFEINQHV
jgi:hypothetical protein